MRLPPQSVEAERAVLGAILLNNEVMAHVAPVVRSEDFYRTGHTLIFMAMSELDRRQMPIDAITLADELRAAGDIEKVGGISYLSGLTSEVPSINHAAHYAAKVAELSRRRVVISAAQDLAEELYSSVMAEDTDAALAAFDTRVSSASSNSDGAIRIGTALPEVLSAIEKVFKGEKPITIETGFDDLDAKCPIVPGDMVLVGGRPGMGKTALGLNIALNASMLGTPTLFVSVEMPKSQIIQRSVAALSGMDTSKFRRGGITDSDFAGIYRSMSKLNVAPLWIYDRGVITPKKACAEIARMARKEGIKLVVLDHVHQLSGKGKRLEVIAEAAHSLKATAVDNEIAVIALCQLNRAVEERMPPRPALSDLKETGELEQVADSVWLMYRQDYYADKGLFDDSKAKRYFNPDFGGTGLISIDKSRHGPTGMTLLNWDGKTTSYRNREWRR